MGFLLYLFLAIVIPVLVWWLVDFMGTPDPINKLAKVIAVLAALVMLFIALNMAIGAGPITIG